MKTPIDRRTALATTLAASAIVISPRLFATENISSAEMAKPETCVHVLSDLAERQFVGSWKISGEKESIEVSLEADRKFTMKCFSIAKVEAGRGDFKWAGKGDWAVRDDSLLIHKTHKWMWMGWGEESRTIYDWCPVIDITPTNISLANNTRLERM